jgi:putative transposase
MKEQSIIAVGPSRPGWEALEAYAREGIRRLLQQMLEKEVEDVLGRRRYARRQDVDAPAGYRNGWGKPRRLSLMSGTITVRRPRMRGLEARFESQLLPLFKRRTEEVGRLLPELYLHGLAQGDFDLALRGLLGTGAPLSAASIARLKAGWQAEYETWKRRRVDELEPVYVWADGIYVKAGLEKDKAAMLVLIAALRNGQKVVLAVESGYRESTESWAALLRDLKARGLRAPRLVIADGHLGIWGAVATVFPEADAQRCWNHRIVNVLDTLPQKLQGEGRALLTAIPYAETRAEAERQRSAFQAWATKKGVAAAGHRLAHDWERLVTFYAFPTAHWKHLRTTNVVESPFAAVRLRTGAAKRFKQVENATAVIWKTRGLAEQGFRRLDAPELLSDVAEGAVYVNGERVKPGNEKAAA